MIVLKIMLSATKIKCSIIIFVNSRKKYHPLLHIYDRKSNACNVSLNTIPKNKDTGRTVIRDIFDYFGVKINPQHLAVHGQFIFKSRLSQPRMP